MLQGRVSVGLRLYPFADAQHAQPLAKQLRVFGTATGLRASDIDTAITQPKKVAYLEQTVRAMEQGQLAAARVLRPTTSDEEFTYDACTATRQLRAAYAGDVVELLSQADDLPPSTSTTTTS